MRIEHKSRITLCHRELPLKSGAGGEAQVKKQSVIDDVIFSLVGLLCISDHEAIYSKFHSNQFSCHGVIEQNKSKLIHSVYIQGESNIHSNFAITK